MYVLDKIDHVIQERTNFNRGFKPPDLISVVWFYFNEKKTKKWANLPAKLLIGQEKHQKEFEDVSVG